MVTLTTKAQRHEALSGAFFVPWCLCGFRNLRETIMKRLTLALAASVAALMGAKPEDTGFLDKSIEYNGAPVKYVVYVPKGYNPGKPLPSILFLHGSGEQGEDGKKQATVGLGAAIKLAEDKWNFIVMFPQKPPGRGGFMDHEKLILDIVEKTGKEYKIDEKRQYITR